MRRRVSKRPRSDESLARVRFPPVVEELVWSFVGGGCGGELLQAYRRAFEMCCDVSLWLLRRLPRAFLFEARLVEEIWPPTVPRPNEGAGGVANGRLRADVSNVLRQVVLSALVETECQDCVDPYWDEWVHVALQWVDPKPNNEGFCEQLALLFADLRAIIFESGFVETRWCMVFRSGLRCGYVAAFGAVLCWCRFLVKETEKVTQPPDGPGANIPRELLNAARACYRLTWPQTES